jgi:hypothetical protein
MLCMGSAPGQGVSPRRSSTPRCALAMRGARACTIDVFVYGVGPRAGRLTLLFPIERLVASAQRDPSNPRARTSQPRGRHHKASNGPRTPQAASKPDTPKRRVRPQASEEQLTASVDAYTLSASAPDGRTLQCAAAAPAAPRTARPPPGARRGLSGPSQVWRPTPSRLPSSCRPVPPPNTPFAPLASPAASSPPPRPPRARRALEALLTEAARVRLHGLSDAEFGRAVRAMEAQARAGGV